MVVRVGGKQGHFSGGGRADAGRWEVGGWPPVAWLCRAVHFLPSPQPLPLPIISAPTAQGGSWAVCLAALSRAVSEDTGMHPAALSWVTLMVSVVIYRWSPVDHVALCPNTTSQEQREAALCPSPSGRPGNSGGTTQTTPTFSRKVPHVIGESESQT